MLDVLESLPSVNAEPWLHLVLSWKLLLHDWLGQWNKLIAFETVFKPRKHSLVLLLCCIHSLDLLRLWLRIVQDMFRRWLVWRTDRVWLIRTTVAWAYFAAFDNAASHLHVRSCSFGLNVPFRVLTHRVRRLEMFLRDLSLLYYELRLLSGWHSAICSYDLEEEIFSKLLSLFISSRFLQKSVVDFFKEMISSDCEVCMLMEFLLTSEDSWCSFYN